MISLLYFTHMLLILHLWNWEGIDICIKSVLFQSHACANSECLLGFIWRASWAYLCRKCRGSRFNDLTVECSMIFLNSRGHLEPQRLWILVQISIVLDAICYIHPCMIYTWENLASWVWIYIYVQEYIFEYFMFWLTDFVSGFSLDLGLAGSILVLVLITWI